MQDFLMAFSAVFPMLVYMVLGRLIRRQNWMELDQFRSLNQVIFKVFIPLMLFVNIYESDFRQSADPMLIAGTAALTLVCFLLLFLLVPRYVTRKADAASIIQGIYRGNYVLFGTTMVAGVYPGGDLGVVSALAAFLTPIYNILAVILFETMRGGQIRPLPLLKKIAQNPLVVAGIGGMLFALTGITLPDLIVNLLKEAGGIASPVALICLGGMLSFASVQRHRKILSLVLALKLVLFPGIAVLLFALAGYRGIELVTILAAFGAPTAVSSTPMAYAMGGNGELAGEIVAVSSAGCILSIFLFVLFMRLGGLI